MIQKITVNNCIWPYLLLLLMSINTNAMTSSLGNKEETGHGMDYSKLAELRLYSPIKENGNQPTKQYTITQGVSIPNTPTVSACTSQIIASAGSSISATVSGNNTSSGYTTQFVLLDNANVIVSGPQATGTFVASTVGQFKIVAVNYFGTLTGLSTGQNIQNITGGCYEISAPKCFDVQPSSCTSSTSVVIGTPLTATSTGNNTAVGYTTQYVLTDANDIIVMGPSSTSSFTPTMTGSYRIYAYNYSGTVSNISVGTNFQTGLTGSCLSKSLPKCFVVIGAPDLTTTVGQPSPSPVVGQPSMIPVTVANIGASSTSGSITEIITIPAGTTFDTFLLPANNNGWTCTATTATMATCTNPIVLVATMGATTFSVPFIPAASQIGTTLTIRGDVSGGSEPSTNVDAKNTSSVTTNVVGVNCPTITNTASNNVNPTTCSGSNGSIKLCGLTANGTGYTVNYDKNGTSATALTSQTADASGCVTITGLTAGSYANIKVSSTGCPSGSNPLSATLTDPSSPAAPSALSGSPNPGCTGGATALTAMGASGASYTWTVSPSGATLSSVTGTVSGTTVSNSLNSTVSGTYTVSVTQTVGGCTSSSAATTTITVNGSATAPVPTASTKSNVCPATTVDLTSLQPTAVAGQTYEWHTVGSNPTAVDLVASPMTAAAGTYYLYDKSTTGGCYSPASSAVVASVTSCCPTITNTASNNVNPTTCSGSNGSIKLCGLTANGTGYTVNYDKNGTAAATALTSQTADASGCITITGLTAGNYANIKVSSTGCPSGSNPLSATLTDPASPTLTASNFTKTNPTTCTGTNGTIKICALVASTSYSTSYNKNGAAQTPVVQTTDASGCLILSSTLSSGTYDTFIVTNTVTMCQSSNSSVSLALSDPAGTTLTLGISQNPSACGLNDGFIQLNGLVTGTQYTLNYNQNGASQTPTIFTASSSTYTLGGLTAGNYTNIAVTNSGCISNSLTKSLSDPTTAIISLGAKTDPTVCSGNDGTFTVSGLASGTAYTLLYDRDGIIQTPISFTPTGASYLVNGLTRGTYTNIRISNTGCISNSLSATLSDPSAPVISSGAINNPSACGTIDGSLSITGLVAGATYTIRYKKNGIWQTTINYPATSSSYTITGLTAGSYTNISASNGGCVSNSLSQQLVEPGAAAIALGTIKQPTLCGATDGSVVITGLTSGLTYVLNYVKDGVTQTSASFVAAGTSYTLTGLGIGNYTGINVKQGGCISISLTAILVNPGAPIIDVIALDTKTCSPGNEGGFIVTSLSQGVAYTLNYLKNGVAQTPISFTINSTSYKVNGLTAGSYSSITITQGSCVSNPGSAVINGPTNVVAPVLSKTSLSSVCPVNNSDLTTITASNTQAGYNLTWHTGTPATALNEVGDATSVGAGTYYGVFSNATTNCFGATSPVTVSVTPCSPDLTTTIGQPSPSPVTGQPSLIPVTVANIGTAATSGSIAEIITIPAGTTFGTFLAPGGNNGWTCTATTLTTATCTNPIVLAATTGVTNFSVPFIPAASQVGISLTIRGDVSGGSEPAANVDAKNTSSVTTPAVKAAPAASLTVTKSVQSGLINTNVNYTYTLTVGNSGTAPTSGMITLKDTLQANLAFIQGVGTGWTCSAVGQLVTCNSSASIAVNATSSVTLTVNPLQTGTYRNKAGAYGGSDPVALNGATAKQSNTVMITVGMNAVKVSIKAFLKGAYVQSAGLMQDSLRVQGIIPLTQPYGKVPYTDIAHTGVDEVTTSSVLSVTGNNAIVDWVMVELRDKANSSSVLYTRASLIQRDGDIVDVDGTSCLTFSGVVADSYFLTVRHRNHLGVMTANPVALTSTCSQTVDFTSSSTAVYKKPTSSFDYSAYPQDASANVMTMWAGNTKPDTYVIFQGPNNDRAPVFNLVATDAGNMGGLSNYAVYGYLRQDINVNGVVVYQGPGNELNVLFSEIFNHPENVDKLANFLIYQQLP